MLPDRSFVYWLFDDACVSPETCGYVGVAKTPRRRITQHRSTLKRPFKWQILFEGTREQCFAKERELRPLPNMGWNTQQGGSHGFTDRCAPRTREKLVARGKSRVDMDLARARLSAVAKAYNGTPAHQAHLAALQQSPVIRANASKRMRALNQTEEARARSRRTGAARFALAIASGAHKSYMAKSRETKRNWSMEERAANAAKISAAQTAERRIAAGERFRKLNQSPAFQARRMAKRWPMSKLNGGDDAT